MKLSVAVVFGGKSTEHEVSIISALQAIENIDKNKYNAIPIYMDKNGDFYYSDDDTLSILDNFKNVKSLISKCINISFIKCKNKTYIKSNEDKLFGKKVNKEIDIVFPIVHGTNVEDGNLQGYFHTLDVPLVGPDCLSSAVSMDKYIMKEYCKAIDIPVIDATRFDKLDYKNVDNIIKIVEDKYNYPVIVKPVNLGSSIGISKAKDRETLLDGLELAFSFAEIVLVEKAITNIREINCAVLGDKFECTTSMLEEPFGNDEILSFADKYMSGGAGKGSKGYNKTFRGSAKNSARSGKLGEQSGMASLSRRVPADIDKDTELKIKTYAMKIFKYIGCSGVARIDFIIDKNTNEIFANEINSIPGSLSYYLFKPMGIEYKELLDRLIEIGLSNYKMRERLEFTFDNNLLK